MKINKMKALVDYCKTEYTPAKIIFLRFLVVLSVNFFCITSLYSAERRITKYDLPGKFYYWADGLTEYVDELGGQICPPRLVLSYEVGALEDGYIARLLGEKENPDHQVKCQALCELGFLKEKTGCRLEAVTWYEQVGVLPDGVDPRIWALARTNLASLYLQDLIENGEQRLGSPGAPEYFVRVLTFPELYRQAVEVGYPPAQSIMATLYMIGIMVDRNLEESLRLLRVSCAQGYPGAFDTLGTMHNCGFGVPKNKAEALRFYEEGARQEYPSSIYGLSQLNTEGIPGVLEKNEGRALELLLQASQLGHVLSKASLASLYASGGLGMAASPADAVRICQECIDRGYAPAKLLMANFYKSGIGVEQSNEQFFRLLQEAASSGLPSAITELGKILFSFTTFQDDVKAVYFLISNKISLPSEEGLRMQAIEMRGRSGDIRSQYAMAICYQLGLGGKDRDPRMASEWYQRAMENPDWMIGKKAAMTAARHFKIFNLFEKAASKGFAPAKYHLARMYENGFGILENKARAVEVYREIAEIGYSPAKLFYARALLTSMGGVRENVLEAMDWMVQVAQDRENGRELLPELCVAAINNDVPFIERITAANRQSKSIEFFHVTPLHLSSFCGNVAATNKLLQLGFDVHSKVGSQALTPLHCALMRGHDFVVEVLSEKEKLDDLMLSVYDCAHLMPRSMLPALVRYRRGDPIFREEISYWKSSDRRLKGANLLHKLIRCVPTPQPSVPLELFDELALVIRSGVVSLNEVIANDPVSRDYFGVFCNRIIQDQERRFGSIVIPASRFLSDMERDVEISLQQNERRLMEAAPPRDAMANQALAAIETEMRRLSVNLQRGIDEHEVAVAGLDFSPSRDYLMAINGRLRGVVAELRAHITDRIGIMIEQEFSFVQQELFSDMFEDIVQFHGTNSPKALPTAPLPTSPLDTLKRSLSDVYKGEGLLLLLSRGERTTELRRITEQYLLRPLKEKGDLEYFIRRTLSLIEEIRRWCRHDFLIANKKSIDCIVQFKLTPIPIDEALLERGRNMLELVRLKSMIYVEVENLSKEFTTFFDKFYGVHVS